MILSLDFFLTLVIFCLYIIASDHVFLWVLCQCVCVSHIFSFCFLFYSSLTDLFYVSVCFLKREKKI